METILPPLMLSLLFPILLVFITSGLVSAEPLVLKVMTYNVHYARNQAGQVNLDEILDLIDDQKPDILALQEVRLSDLKRIRQRAGLEYAVRLPTYNSRFSGLGLLSRWPITFQSHRLVHSDGKRAFIQAAIDLNGIPLAFYNMHLTREGIEKNTPLKDFSLEMSSDSPRYQQVAQLKTLLDRDRHRFKIVVGDFNTFTNSRAYSELKASLNEATEGFPSVPGTYRSLWFFQPKIDHIFHSPNIHVRQAAVIERGPSDHFPVTAVMEIDPGCFAGQIDAGDLKKAQSVLSRLGLYQGAIDAVPGPRTRKAVADFQKKNSLIIDGCLDRPLLDRLLKLKEQAMESP